MPSSSHAPAHRGAYRDGVLVHDDGDLRGRGHLVEDGGHPAAGGVAQAAHLPAPQASSSAGHEPVAAARCRSSRSASMSSSPRASMIVTPWSPIGPDTITASPGRTRGGAQPDGPLEHADARRW